MITCLLWEVTITSKLTGTTMYKSLLGEVLALKRAVVVSTFRTVYSVRPQARPPEPGGGGTGGWRYSPPPHTFLQKKSAYVVNQNN